MECGDVDDIVESTASSTQHGGKIVECKLDLFLEYGLRRTILSTTHLTRDKTVAPQSAPRQNNYLFHTGPDGQQGRLRHVLTFVTPVDLPYRTCKVRPCTTETMKDFWMWFNIRRVC